MGPSLFLSATSKTDSGYFIWLVCGSLGHEDWQETPFIIGELACGNLKNGNEIISLLHSLPMAPTIEFDEFLFFIEKNHLMGKGVGFVDVQLLASAKLAGIALWTADKRLKSAADQLELTFKQKITKA